MPNPKVARFRRFRRSFRAGEATLELPVRVVPEPEAEAFREPALPEPEFQRLHWHRRGWGLRMLGGWVGGWVVYIIFSGGITFLTFYTHI